MDPDTNGVLAMQSTNRNRAVRKQKRDVSLVRSTAALATLGTFSFYCGIRGVLKGYQQLRRRSLRRLVVDVCPVLDAMGVQYWVDFGTLLGIYREKDIIVHDNDADIVVLNPEWDLLCVELKRRLSRHCKVYFVHPSEDPSVRWLRVCTGFGVLDLYGGFYKSGESISIPQGHGSLCDAPAACVFPLSRTRWGGVDVATPGDVQGMLQWRYGEDFMVPRYMDKGRDSVEQGKLYARLLSLLARMGLRV